MIENANVVPPTMSLCRFACRGWLWKQGGRYKSWKWRMFEINLYLQQIAYFVDDQGSYIKGVVSLSDVERAMPAPSNSFTNQYQFFEVFFLSTSFLLTLLLSFATFYHFVSLYQVASLSLSRCILYHVVSSSRCISFYHVASSISLYHDESSITLHTSLYHFA